MNVYVGGHIVFSAIISVHQPMARGLIYVHPKILLIVTVSSVRQQQQQQQQH